jgi:hypothetical protein
MASSSSSSSSSGVPDLKHRDWLLASTQKLIQQIDNNVVINISDTDNGTTSGGKIITISNISEEIIDKLPFLVNTDNNNNYFYLENFSVYLNNQPTPMKFPQLTEVTKQMFANSDINGFTSNAKIHTPFAVENLGKTSYKGMTFSGYVDLLSSSTAWVTPTTGKKKTYTAVFNPDKYYPVG